MDLDYDVPEHRYMTVPRTHIFYDLINNIPYTNDDFLTKHTHRGLEAILGRERYTDGPITLVSYMEPTEHSTTPETKVVQYHGSVHPQDACLVRALIGKGFHVIGGIKWDSLCLQSGHFTPIGPQRADGDVPPIPMQILTARLRWSVLAYV